MTITDQVFLALTAWKENRAGLRPGMQSIINVIMNRVARDHTSPYSECVRKLQFSSLTAPGDPELAEWWADGDPQYATALALAGQASMGQLQDLTNGSVDYYNPRWIRTTKTITLPTGETIPFPETWNPAAVVYETAIAGHVFFKEV